MEAPAEGIAAFPIDIPVRGPLPPNHRLLAAPPGSDSRAIAGSSTLRPGQVFTVVLPEEAGEYELRYVATTPPYDIKLRQTIRVRAPQARIEAAESAPAGSRLPASCVGDCSPRAMLTVVPAGSSDQEIGRRNILGPSATTRLLLPNRPGQYEIRYVTVTDPKKVFARKPLTIR
jgi:Ca-activated chloride channel family protein